MEKGNIYQNKNTREYTQVKEVTYYCLRSEATRTQEDNIAAIVHSDDCTYVSDSTTTVGRKVSDRHTFFRNYRKVDTCPHCNKEI